MPLFNFGKLQNDFKLVAQDPDQDRIRNDLSTFFGPRADKYLAIYETMRERDKAYVSTFNWVVLVTNFPWYFYRKLYVTGTLIIFLPIIVVYLLPGMGNAGLSAAFAISAKSQYVGSAIKRIKQADALGLVGQEREEYLRRAGGVSVVGAVLSSLLFAGMVALVIWGIYLKSHPTA